jgi:hypothetical protein
MDEGTLYIERYYLERREESLYRREKKQSRRDQPEVHPQGDIIPRFSGT